MATTQYPTPDATARHADGENAFDLIRRHVGIVWVKPDHHRHTVHVETFTGDLSDNRDMAVSS
jgi:hypothetical protein